ncbi:MAG: HPr family phosphocarrier protein [Planctomycetota bacterium]
MPMKECTVTIVNRLGLHARPAMTFVDTAQTFASIIRVRNGDTDVDGKSIMEVMMLAATKGTSLLITADGDDAEAALEELKKLVASGFGEE